MVMRQVKAECLWLGGRQMSPTMKPRKGWPSPGAFPSTVSARKTGALICNHVYSLLIFNGKTDHFKYSISRQKLSNNGELSARRWGWTT